MPQLFIECPKTKDQVSTGIDVPLNMDVRGFGKNTVQCTACGAMHDWTGDDAFFVTEDAPE